MNRSATVEKEATARLEEAQARMAAIQLQLAPLHARERRLYGLDDEV